MSKEASAGTITQTGGGDAGERARYEGAVAIANKVLDRINADPDDDLATLARQFLRAIERERSSHREGAEAMRERCAAAVLEHLNGYAEDEDKDAANVCNVIRRGVRPMPDKAAEKIVCSHVKSR